MAVIVAFHHHASDNVARHEIGSVLDARVAQLEYPGQGTEKRGLTESWNSFEQDMTAGDKADQNSIDYVRLANDDLADLVAHTVQVVGCSIDQSRVSSQCLSHLLISFKSERLGTASS